MKNFFKYSMLIVIVLSCFFALLGCDTPADPTPTPCTHDYEGHVAIEATCDQDGVMLYSCQLCGDIYSETIPATGHSYSDDWSWDDDSHWHNANCEHTDLKDDYGFHEWDDGEVITAPGCTTDGTKLYTCDICGAYRTEPISATGHTYGTTWEHDQDSHWLCATCQHDTEIGSEGAHDWEEVRVLVAPTCLNEGVMLWQCSVCERPDERPIEATGHSYSEEYSFNVEKHWLESTCGCDVVDEEADHSFDRNGLCTVCNASRVYSVGLQFTLSPDGEYYVLSGRGTCEEQDIIVPATYKDLPVKAVADGAFENDYNIITLSLPGSIEVIGQSAFEDARMLESVTLSEGLINVKDSAFRWATIREIVIPDSVTTIGEYAFANISYELMDVATIGSGVTSIGEFAFIARTVNYNAIEVTEYERAFVDVETINVGQYVKVLPDNFCNSGEELEHVNFHANSELERIGERAFLYCVKLYHIEIPAGVTYIGEMAFADCAKLIDVKNDSSVTARIGEADAGSLAKYARNLYSSTYGATKLVYNGDFVTYEDGDDKIFIAYHGTDTSVTIPDGTTEIYHYAMLYSDVQEIIISDGVTKIDSNAFSRCSALTEVSIPDTVTEIGAAAFAWSYSLTYVRLPVNMTVCSTGLFYACTGLTEVILPDNLRSIESGAFVACGDFAEFIMPATVAEIDERAFADTNIWAMPEELYSAFNYYNGAYYLGTATNPYFYLIHGDDTKAYAEVEFHNDTQRMANGAFRDNKTIQKVVLSPYLSGISTYAFADCENLTDVNLKSNELISAYAFYNSGISGDLTLFNANVGDYAFQGCVNLEKLTIAGSTRLAYGAFYDSGINELVVEDTPILDAHIFFGCRNLVDVYWNAQSATYVDWTHIDSTWREDRYEVFAGIGASDNGCVVTIGKDVVTLPNYLFNCLTYGDATYVTQVIFEEGELRDIAEGAFSYQKHLESVNLPQGLNNIEQFAFDYCSALTEIVIPDKVVQIQSAAFANSGLVEITIPDSVTYVGDAAFANCENLQTVNIGKGVKRFDGVAFVNCPNLAEVNYNAVHAETDRLNRIFSECAVYGCVLNIGPDVVAIDQYAFEQLDATVNFHPEMNLQTIGDYAFAYNYRATEIVIPDTVTSIGDCAFYNMTALDSITFGKNCSLLGIRLLEECTALTEINYNAVDAKNAEYETYYISLGNKIGSASTGVVINIGKDVKVIPGGIFKRSGSRYESDTTLHNKYVALNFEEGSSLEEIGAEAFAELDSLNDTLVLPNTVKSIGAWAFEYCYNLTISSLPVGLESVGINAFSGCDFDGEVSGNMQYVSANGNPYYFAVSVTDRNLQSCILHENTKVLLGSAMVNCEKLTEVKLNDGLERICGSAIIGCYAIGDLVIPDSVVSIGDYAFVNSLNIRLLCEAAEKPEGWSQYWNRWNTSHEEIFETVFGYVAE